jgi:hypothetical protein
MYSSIPTSLPKECTLSTQPLSMAGIRVGCGLRAQYGMEFRFFPLRFDGCRWLIIRQPFLASRHCDRDLRTGEKDARSNRGFVACEAVLQPLNIVAQARLAEDC